MASSKQSGGSSKSFRSIAREGQQMPDVSKLSSVLSGALGAGGFVAGGPSAWGSGGGYAVRCAACSP
jgi:hypothetical protein